MKDTPQKQIIVSLLLAVCIYLLNLLYVLITSLAGTVEPMEFFIYIMLNSIYSFVLYIIILLAIIIVPVCFAVCKFGLKLKYIFVSIPVLFCLFLIYAPPWFYLLACTAEYRFIFGYSPQMAPIHAASAIMVQYGIVMLITALIAAAIKKYSKNYKSEYSAQ